MACDIPLIYKYLGEVIGPVVYDGTLPLNKVKDSLEPLVQQNKAGHVMAEALSVAVQIAGVSNSTFYFFDPSAIRDNVGKMLINTMTLEYNVWNKSEKSLRILCLMDRSVIIRSVLNTIVYS